MSSITSYLYDQKIQVVVSDSNVGRIMSLFYSPNLKIYRGINNEVRVNFVNKDQQKVNLLGKTISLAIVDNDTNMLLLRKVVTPIDVAKGVSKFNITEGDLLNLDSGFYTYSFKVTDDEGNEHIGYADSNYSAGGKLELVHGVYPEFKDSIEEDFAAGDKGSTIYNSLQVNRNTAHHTAEVFFDTAFTGTLLIQASLNAAIQTLNDDDFVTVKTIDYTAQAAPDLVHWNGMYTAIRFIRSSVGISKILYRD